MLLFIIFTTRIKIKEIDQIISYRLVSKLKYCSFTSERHVQETNSEGIIADQITFDPTYNQTDKETPRDRQSITTLGKERND